MLTLTFHPLPFTPDASVYTSRGTKSGSQRRFFCDLRRLNLSSDGTVYGENDDVNEGDSFRALLFQIIMLLSLDHHLHRKIITYLHTLN